MKKYLYSALFLAAVTTGAHAQSVNSTTATLTVAATIAPTCTANATAVTAAFGSFADRLTEKTAAASLLVSCTSTLTAAPIVRFSGGQNQTGSNRFMRGAANPINRLQYDLKNSANALIAINATTGETMAANGTNAFRLDFSASILPTYLTNAVADTYSDTVTLTINW